MHKDLKPLLKYFAVEPDSKCPALLLHVATAVSPDAEPVAVSAAADMMAVDSAPGGLAAEALADFRRHGGGAEGSHRVNLGVFNLAAADPMATVQQQPSTKAALYANYQQVRMPCGSPFYCLEAMWVIFSQFCMSKVLFCA